MRLMFWNVKYFGPTSEKYAERVQDIVDQIRRRRPDIVVLIEMTSRANEVLTEITAKLLEKEVLYQCNSVDIDGGNHEHFAVLLTPMFGDGAVAGLRAFRYPIGAGTRKIGHIGIGRTDVDAFGLYICHPSPCALTNATALKNTWTFLDEETRARAIMVGDFNDSHWDRVGEGAVNSEAATHKGTSGTLRTIDGAVALEMKVAIDSAQRVTSAGAKSDHAYMVFEIA